jgi:cell division protein FtsQ
MEHPLSSPDRLPPNSPQPVTRRSRPAQFFTIPLLPSRSSIYSQGWRFSRPGSGVAKQTSKHGTWISPPTTRQTSALAYDGDEEDEDASFLRPPSPAEPRRRSRKAAERAPGRAPDYDPSEEAEAFLRRRRRVSPRKGSLLRRLAGSRFGRILLGALFVVLCVGAGFCFWAVRTFFLTDAHFRIDSSAQIQSAGNTEFTRDQLLQVFGSDIGRNIFYVPLAKREAALEAQPWIRSAEVMRLLPDTIRVRIQERTPVAFVRIGHDIELVDAEGTLLNMSPSTLAARHYSFPVITGLDPNGTPASRAARMQLFARFMTAIDSGPQQLSEQLSEVDLSDLDDVRAVVPAQGTDILLHFGTSDYLARFRAYQQHIASWRQQYPNLSAVDLRYERQVVLKMADAAAADQAAEDHPLPDTAQTTFPVTESAPAAPEKLAPAGHSGKHPAVGKRAPRAATHTSRPAHGKTAAHHRKKWTPHYISGAGRGL